MRPGASPLIQPQLGAFQGHELARCLGLIEHRTRKPGGEDDGEAENGQARRSAGHRCQADRRHAATVAQSLEASGFLIRSQIIWDKMRLVIGRGDYHWSHEPLL